MITQLPEKIQSVDEGRLFLDTLYKNGETKCLVEDLPESGSIEALMAQMNALPDWSGPVDYVKVHHGIDLLKKIDELDQQWNPTLAASAAAPLKLAEGGTIHLPEGGAIEFDGQSLYYHGKQYKEVGDPYAMDENELQRIRTAVHNYEPRNVDLREPVILPETVRTADIDLLISKITYHYNVSTMYLRLFNDSKKDFELISKDPFTIAHFQPQRPDEYAIFRDMLQRMCEYHRYQAAQAQAELDLFVIRSSQGAKDGQ